MAWSTSPRLFRLTFQLFLVYAESTPKFVGFMPFITAALRKIVSIVPKFLRLSVVGLMWLIILPLITSMAWEMYFGSTADILVDVAINSGNISINNSTIEASTRSNATNNNGTRPNDHVPIWDIFSALMHGTAFKGFVSSTGQHVTLPMLWVSRIFSFSRIAISISGL